MTLMWHFYPQCDGFQCSSRWAIREGLPKLSKNKNVIQAVTLKPFFSACCACHKEINPMSIHQGEGESTPCDQTAVSAFLHYSRTTLSPPPSLFSGITSYRGWDARLRSGNHDTYTQSQCLHDVQAPLFISCNFFQAINNEIITLPFTAETEHIVTVCTNWIYVH